MATVQGICRNCGSLMMIDDRDETCECVFCNCVFPSSEAIEIFNDPDGREFPNEKFEPSSDGKRHFTTRVFSDESIEKAIKREEIAKSHYDSDYWGYSFTMPKKNVTVTCCPYTKAEIWGTE